MPNVDQLSLDIERMRVRLGRQRKEILELERAGISIVAAEALLQRMLEKSKQLREQRNMLKRELPAQRRAWSGRK